MTKKIISFLVLLVMVFSVAGCRDKTAAGYYKDMYDITLPKGIVVECDIKDYGGFPVEGMRYTVFKLEAEITDELYTELDLKEPSEEFVDFYGSKPIKQTFDYLINSYKQMNIEIPDGFLPDWESDYVWNGMYNKSYSLLIIIYSLSDYRMIFFHNND